MEEKSSFTTRRVVYLNNGFSEKNVQEIIGQIDRLNYEEGEISLIIGSNGGSFVGAQKLYERIEISPNPINGLVVGDCFSSATIALLACKNKQATKLSKFLLHNLVLPVELYVTINDTLADVSKILSEKMALIKHNNDSMVNIYLENLRNFDEKSLKDFIEKEKIIYAQEAKSIGLIDKII